jgi:hypothetical protein
MFAREITGRIRYVGIINNVLRMALPGIYSLSKETLFANECLEDVACVLNIVNSNLSTFCSCSYHFLQVGGSE